MHLVTKYLFLVLALASSPAFCAYANLSPPPGWSGGTPAVPGHTGNFTFGPSANASSFKGSTVLTNATLNVGGRAVTMPVAMRTAANAATMAARFSYGNPAMFAAGLAIPLAYKWLSDNGFNVVDGLWQQKLESKQTFLHWCVSSTSICAATKELLGDQVTPQYSNANYRAEWRPHENGTSIEIWRSYIGPTAGVNRDPVLYTTIGTQRIMREGTVVTTGPATEEGMVSKLADKVIPDGVPEELKLPLPVVDPVINPDPGILPQPEPAPALQPRPYFVPSGTPRPTSDPMVWYQPGFRIKPAPRPGEPWLVDIVPEDLPQTDGVPKTDAELNPSTPVAPGVQKPETPDLCATNPDILACQKLGELTAPELETKNVPVSITPQAGWGAGNATCPAPRTLPGAKVTWSFQPMCDLMNGLRPILIAVSWLAAAFILLGVKGGD